VTSTWAVLAMNWYMRLTDEAVIVKPLFSFAEQDHPYTDVTQVVLTSHVLVKQELIAREGLHLRFRDGSTWSTGDTFRLPSTAQERNQLLEWLLRKTGRQVIRARLLNDVPGW
jgi:hypothetical protein